MYKQDPNWIEGMILTCPSCSARYMIASSSIGEGGRNVRCAKCHHQWFQKSERDSLDDLIRQVQSEDQDIDIGFGDTHGKKATGGKAKAASPAKPKAPSKIGQLAKVCRDKLKKITHSGQSIGQSYAARLSPEKLRPIAGGMVALAMMMVLLWGFVAQRTIVVHTIPALAPFFHAAGYTLNIDDKQRLAFDRIKAEFLGDTQIIISGNLINVLAKEAELRPLKLAVLGEKGDVLEEKTIAPPAPKLKGEDSLAIDLKMNVSAGIRSRAKQLKISMPNQGEEPSKAPENASGSTAKNVTVSSSGQ